MKRSLFLLAIVTLVVWLAQGAPSLPSMPSGAPLRVNSPSASSAAPQNTCCLIAGETDPHWECFAGACYQMGGCGPNVDCSTCGCDPVEESACIYDGGYWDSTTCTCDYGCDPNGTEQQACISAGGYWDPANCTCTNLCDPTGSEEQACTSAGRHWDPVTCTCGAATVCVCEPQQLIDYQEYEVDYCDGYYYQYCTDAFYTYEQDCDSPCGYRQWTEEYFSCYSFGEYCGGGGGGGGGGDCWDTGDCWCDSDWGICCEYDYCYEE
jgi:hypothetical protein